MLTSLLVSWLRQISERLPLEMAEASPTDLLANFTNPIAHDSLEIMSKDLWEGVLNPMLKGIMGWGTDINWAEHLCRGALGMAGVTDFVKYYVKSQGVNELLLEGKLSRLMDCAQELM